MSESNLSGDVFPPGTLSLGCNYWASHAGTSMWRDWRADIVDADLRTLAENGLTWLRVFPLWPDFQPIHQLRGQNGAPIEVRLGEDPLPDDDVGQAGVSSVMLARFIEFCQIAERHGLRLVVGLITGWMSGRLFVPPALEGLNPITDATSMAWQVKFVRTLAKQLGEQSSIAAWDLGNECNCMGAAPTPDAAYLWTASIANAIRAADSTRPIVSGMHSLSTRRNAIGNPWLIEDQGQLTDILTTHPYPYWVRHTNLDAVDDFRTTLHATAESRFYADIAGKPCIAEEIGTMGPMIGGDDVSAGFARVNMLSLWVNNCPAMAWWCSHDQTELAHAPYDWNGVELELGLLRTDGSAKPVLQEMAAFQAFLGQLPFRALPPPKPDAVCVLTYNQDDWAVAYSSYVLAKQAKLQLAFSHIDQGLPDSELYLLPSLTGANCVPRRRWLELLARVEQGATLYVSLADGIVPHFNSVAGVAVHRRAQGSRPRALYLIDGVDLDLGVFDELHLEPATAEVLGRCSDDGLPLFWRNSVGAGSIYVLAAPLERFLTRTPRAFSAEGADYWQIYAHLRDGQHPGKAGIDPDIAVTHHRMEDGKEVVCMINHSRVAKEVAVPDGLSMAMVLRGNRQGARLQIGPLDAAILLS